MRTYIGLRTKFITERLDKQWFIDRLAYSCIDIEQPSEKTIIEAEQILHDKIEIFGTMVDVSEHIHWHEDFKCGYTWPNGKYHTKYVCIRKGTDDDVKTVWELSRCHHLLWLGEAYKQTKDEKYAKHIVSTVNKWIDENPFDRSINWTCSMEVAIRAVNWIYALNMVINASCVTVNFLHKAFRSLYEHAYHIYNNLENDFPYSANHYASDIAGLVFLGYLFDDTVNGKKWRNYALQEFLYEVRTQVLPSGVHFERSISYHRLMTELFLYSYLLIRRNSPDYDAIDIKSRISSMIGFVQTYTKPNGLSPLFADNDNGRFLPFIKNDYQDHRYLIDIAKRNGLYMFQSDDNKLYMDAGMAFLKNDNYYIAFTNTGVSRYNKPWKNRIIGTHTHQDALSFELSKKEEDFIVDSGSYMYTSSIEKRNEFRSTAKHNTVTVDGDNQYLLDDYFSIKTSKYNYYTEPQQIDFLDDGKTKKVSSSFYWKEKNVKHERSIMMTDNTIEMIDDITCNDEHTFEWNFHFTSGVIVKHQKTNEIKLSNRDEILSIIINCEKPFSFCIIDDMISPAYGILKESKTLKIVVDAERNFKMQFIFE